MKDIKVRERYLGHVLVFLFVFLPKAVLCMCTHPLSIPSDEIATMSLGAYIAGLDWSAVISHAGYYGGGMSIFTAPIYLLTDNPLVIYRSVGLFCAILQSLGAVIAYWIAKKYYNIKEKTAILIGVVCGFFVMAQADIVFNENAMVLVTWIAMLLLYKLHESVQDKRLNCVYTFLMMFVLTYAMTLHTRSVTYWIALVIVVIVYRIGYRKWLVNLPVACGTGVLGWFVSQMFIKWTQNVLWHLENGETVRNAVINTNGGFHLLFELKDIRAWLSIILGQIHTMGVFTGGFAILFVVVFLIVLFCFFFMKKHREKIMSDQVISLSIPIIVFFLSAAAITIAGQSISWLANSIEVYEGGYSSQAYGVKAYGYLRYFGIYCGPLLMIGMVWLLEKRDFIIRYFKWTLGILCIVEAYWVLCIAPYIRLCTEWGVFYYYHPFTWHIPTDPVGYRVFMMASVAMFILFVTGYLAIKKYRTELIFVFMLVLFVNTYCYHTLITDDINADICITWADDGYRIINQVEDVYELPSVIYVEDLWGKWDHNNYYVYQFLLNRYKIVPERPRSGMDEAVLFSNNAIDCGEYDTLLEEGYLYSEIGDHEILFVKGHELQKAFESTGVELKSEY